jgi:hypothetical protein
MLPISVVVPHRRSRAEWFSRHCLPSIIENEPAQIIIEDQDGGACEKRNSGAAKALQYYLFFADDDSVLLPGALREMLEALETDQKASFAYSDTKMVLYDGVPYPNSPGIRKAQPWDLETLKKGNYVETMSLMRRDVFPGFDPSIQRFQDWDLWLTLGAAGHRGVYIPKVLFELHHFDVGISASVPFEASLARIREKHRL